MIKFLPQNQIKKTHSIVKDLGGMCGTISISLVLQQFGISHSIVGIKKLIGDKKGLGTSFPLVINGLAKHLKMNIYEGIEFFADFDIIAECQDISSTLLDNEEKQAINFFVEKGGILGSHKSIDDLNKEISNEKIAILSFLNLGKEDTNFIHASPILGLENEKVILALSENGDKYIVVGKDEFENNWRKSKNETYNNHSAGIIIEKKRLITK